MNPLLYVLAYGADFVAQATPADMAGLAAIIEEAIRYPGFSFVNVQSPCVTYGDEDQQVKAHKATAMKPLAEPGARLRRPPRRHGPRPALRQQLYTGVFYRNPEPPPTYAALVQERQAQLAKDALPRERILDLFIKK